MTRLLALSRLKARVGRAGALLTAFVGLLGVGEAAHATCIFPNFDIASPTTTLDVARDHFEVGSPISGVLEHSSSITCTETHTLTGVRAILMRRWEKLGETMLDGRVHGVYGRQFRPAIGLTIDVSMGGGPFTALTLDPHDGVSPEQGIPSGLEFAAGAPYNMTIRTRLIAMGPINLSTTYDFQFAGFAFAFDGPTVPSPGAVQLNIAHSLIVNAASCTLVNDNQLIAMRSIAAGNFDGSGKTFHETPFDLNIDCPETSTGINVWATFSDATDPGNVSSHLTLTGNQPAKGVAIEIVNGTTKDLVKFGPDSSGKNNTNQFEVGTIPLGGQSLSLPFIARYVQTAPVVEPGDANASATVTFSYQ